MEFLNRIPFAVSSPYVLIKNFIEFFSIFGKNIFNSSQRISRDFFSKFSVLRFSRKDIYLSMLSFEFDESED